MTIYNTHTHIINNNNKSYDDYRRIKVYCLVLFIRVCVCSVCLFSHFIRHHHSVSLTTRCRHFVVAFFLFVSYCHCFSIIIVVCLLVGRLVAWYYCLHLLLQSYFFCIRYIWLSIFLFK